MAEQASMAAGAPVSCSRGCRCHLLFRGISPQPEQLLLQRWLKKGTKVEPRTAQPFAVDRAEAAQGAAAMANISRGKQAAPHTLRTPPTACTHPHPLAHAWQCSHTTHKHGLASLNLPAAGCGSG